MKRYTWPSRYLDLGKPKRNLLRAPRIEGLCPILSNLTDPELHAEVMEVCLGQLFLVVCAARYAKHH